LTTKAVSGKVTPDTVFLRSDKGPRCDKTRQSGSFFGRVRYAASASRYKGKAAVACIESSHPGYCASILH
jgi:hypothetical protein